MVSALIVISILCAGAASICKAVCDIITHHYYDSIFDNKRANFWKPTDSWMNKWKWENNKPTNKEAFWGSSRWFVMFTDAWHLFGFLERFFFIVSFCIVGFLSGHESLWYMFGVLIDYIVFALLFHLFYTNIFKNKDNK